MAERSRFGARSTNSVPLIGIGMLVAIMLPLIRGGAWTVGGPVIGLLVLLSQYFQPKGTVLIVDKQGVHDRRLGTQMIPWRYISGVDKVVLQGVTYVNIHLTLAGEEFVHLPLWRQALTPLLKMLGLAPVHVTASGLDARPEEIYSAIFTAYTIASQS